MEQQNFDATSILSKLRQGKSPQPHSLPQGRSAAAPNRLRRERPEVRQELQNEIDHLAGEVAKLKRENRQLLAEKEELEFRCGDIKEKADATISKLRNKLVAMNKRLDEMTLSSPKDRYTAKKNFQKNFAKGAGVLNITNRVPCTVPVVDPGSSIQNLTFSQYMKRNSQESEEYNAALRSYNQNELQSQKLPMAQSDHHENFSGSFSQKGYDDHDFQDAHYQPPFASPPQILSHPNKKVQGPEDTSKGPSRKKSFAHIIPVEESLSNELCQFSDRCQIYTNDSEPVEEKTVGNSDVIDEDLPVVYIDLRSP